MTDPLRQSPDPVSTPHARRSAVCLAVLVGTAVFLAPAASLAQAPQTHKAAAHRRPAAQKPPAGQPVQPVPPPPPVAPPQPNWPVNSPPSQPAVTFNSQGLHIVAENSSLSSILNQVSTETGAKVEGLSGDERIFGVYGPGQPREVLAQLLSGVNYNVLILGDEALGQPLHITLSPRPSGSSQAGNNRPQQQEQQEDEVQPEPEEQPYQPPIVRPPMNQPQAQPFNGRPMTPQERIQEMQERQREQQQQQQPQY